MLRPDRLRNTNIVNEIRNGFNIDFSSRLPSVILFSAFSFRDFWMFSISYLMKLSSEPWSHVRASLAFELSPAIIPAELKCLGLGASHLLSNTSVGFPGRGTSPWWRGWPGPSWPLPAATSWASSRGWRSGALRSLAAKITVTFYYHFSLSHLPWTEWSSRGRLSCQCSQSPQYKSWQLKEQIPDPLH